jgi:hypothetical protein
MPILQRFLIIIISDNHLTDKKYLLSKIKSVGAKGRNYAYRYLYKTWYYQLDNIIVLKNRSDSELDPSQIITGSDPRN